MDQAGGWCPGHAGRVVCSLVTVLVFASCTARLTLSLPDPCTRFPVGEVKELIRQVLREHLAEKQTFGSETSKEIADEIKNKLKGAYLCG